MHFMSYDPAAETPSRFRKMLKAFMADERGSTAIEYGLIASIIVLAIIGSLTAISDILQSDLYEPVRVGLSGG